MKMIVVLDRGWVFVGDVASDDRAVEITNALNIRRWGTSKGIGQLASEGKQPNTELDPAGTVRAPMTSVVAMIECDPSKW